MYLHFIAIIAIVLAIVVLQGKVFFDSLKKINQFKDIFEPNGDDYSYGNKSMEELVAAADDDQLKDMLKQEGCDVNDFYSISENEEGIEVFVFNASLARQCILSECSSENVISSRHYNTIFEDIKNSINSYLSNNKGSVSDFHLMKDIVDRNCDSREEEINTQIPVPLYLGLMGTMVGILVGVGYLWLSGDLSSLLDARGGKSGADGVEALLGGVALAMFSSIVGIILTTIGSMKAKAAKAEEEKNKHIFLSWIQANLLPNLSNDTAQTLERMSNNLVAFNSTFSNNTAELGKTLAQVNDATKSQRELMIAVEKLADKNISKQNLEVYNALKNCSEEIGTLAKYLSCTNEYLVAVRELNEKLDKDERRSKAVERMAAFFENEATQLDQRKAMISKTVGEIDSQLEEQLRKLGDNASENVKAFNVALSKQQDALQKRLEETQIIVDELKSLAPIKESISKFEKATAEQSRKIDRLTESIRLLAESKVNGTVYTSYEKSEPKSSPWKRASIWSVSILGGMVLLALIIANWGSIYNFLVALFKI